MKPCPVQYRVQVADLHAHLFAVSLTIAAPAAEQVLSLPVWIPGSYLVREFSKHLQKLEARQGQRRVQVRQVNKNTWQLAAQVGQPLQLHYEVYAHDASVRTAWLNAQRGFFNGTSLCLRVHDQEGVAHGLELVGHTATPAWSVATGLEPVRCNARGWGHYQAANYDELVDCPVEMGTFWSGEFSALGIPHQFVVAGASAAFDGARLLADTQKICETAIRFWHGTGRAAGRKAPQRRYVFMLNAVDDGYGGLEHRNSTALICTRRDLPQVPAQPQAQGEGYTTLLGLISHEYFHTWNVKRLRPADFSRYAYDSEQYTALLWFFEGFTSYYDDLLLKRAGLIETPAYLKLLNKTLNQVLQTPGRKVQSVAQASLDAWVKYYRPDENTPNATVSYYTKGALVALCLDLTLRAEGRTHLDAVMQGLWQRCQGGPMTQADLLAVLAELGGRSFERELNAWVHSTAELPVKELLLKTGVRVTDDPAPLAQRLGLRVAEAQGITVKHVLSGGAAEQAGFSAGDEWLGLEHTGKTGGAWRLHRLDDVPLYAGAAKQVLALVARDKQLLRLKLNLPAGGTCLRLGVEDARAVASWLEPAKALAR